MNVGSGSSPRLAQRDRLHAGRADAGPCPQTASPPAQVQTVAAAMRHKHRAHPARRSPDEAGAAASAGQAVTIRRTPAWTTLQNRRSSPAASRGAEALPAADRAIALSWSWPSRTLPSPAAITFDGNGRMYVTELRSYMNDADGTDTLTPTGRISRHEDVDNDGVYERHTVFVDKLTFPRFAMPFGADAILTKSSNDPDVWKYTDTNGDGVADKRELFATDFGRGGNVEHQESHLTWAMDNWLYSTYNAVRLRWTPHGVLREPIGSPGGAWGVTQDNDGKIWIQGGASGQPGYYQLPLAYGNFAIPGTTDPALRTTWGAPVRIADMQPGMPSVRMPDGSLHTSTAGAGGDIFRGHRLPQDLVGDYFYGEVVARIVRRIRPEVREGHHLPHELLPELRVHPAHRSALPFRGSGDRSGRHDVPRGHVPGHHPGVPVDAARHVPPREDRAVSARQGHRPRPDLAAQVRRARARSHAAAHAQRDARAARPAPGPSERLVARHGATVARPEAGQVGGPGASADRAHRRRICSNVSMRCGRSKVSARSIPRSRDR